MAKREGESCHCHGEGEELANCRDRHALGVYWHPDWQDEGKGDACASSTSYSMWYPPIQRHKSEYTLVHPSPIGGWGFAPIVD